MDDQRVGLIVRALRRRRAWRQVDLAVKVGCSQSLVSLIERGHLDRVALSLVRNVLAELEARIFLAVSWRSGELDRLLDEDHAWLTGLVASRLRAAGWLVETEVTYSEFGERGSYDILAFHPASGTVLAIEIKTDFASAEATLRKLDEKSRLARTVADKRFGWQASAMGRLLVMPNDRTLRRRVERVRPLLVSSYPAASVRVREWIQTPAGGISGIWFVSDTNGRGTNHKPGGRSRVRRRRNVSTSNTDAA